MGQEKLRNARPWYLTFHDLMPYRVHEILLVSSNYDAFTLEEDGRLTESILTQYSEATLSAAPRLTRVSTGSKAMEVLAERRVDLVVTMMRIADTDVSAFGREVKKLYPRMPVVLLVLTEAELLHFPGGVDPQAIDRVWVWTGDPQILLSIIKQVEDSRNCEHDTRSAGVRVVIVVEDSPRHYSAFLSQLYPELMAQSDSLAAEGVNDLHRLMRTKTRPKILLATNFEEALDWYRRFREYVVAVICDVRFQRAGEEDADAGFELVRILRADDEDLPILLQSAESQRASQAAELGIAFADKNSPSLLRDIQTFVKESLGFGDFVFRLPDRTEVGRARDMFELEQGLKWVPAASIEYHARRNHFSRWLQARSMFGLADLVRPHRLESSGGSEGTRAFLIDAIRDARIREQEGVITDLAKLRHINESHFVRVARGSIGGKARGLAFVSSLLAHQGLRNQFQNLRIDTPRSFVIGTDEFDQFMKVNRLAERRLDTLSDDAILKLCLSARLSDELVQNLKRILATLKGPIAVRSSCLLEDSQMRPFAGVFATYMLPNNHSDPYTRLDELCRAVKAVYASTFSEEARSYLATTSFTLEEAKMAVLIQEMIGSNYGTRFYPAISGVALSYNYYPVSGQKADEGIAMVALGCGQMIVRGGKVLSFSPSQPTVLPHLGNTADLLRYSQSEFYALDLTRPTCDFGGNFGDSVTLYELDAAESDGPLALVGSIYNRDDDTVRDGLNRPGTRVVTFNNLLKWDVLPLAPALAKVLQLLHDGLGYAVEVEFALDVGEWDRREPSGFRPEDACLYLLQARPQAIYSFEGTELANQSQPAEQIFCRTDRSLGHGTINDIRDVVYVRRNDLEAVDTPAIAAQVGTINHHLLSEHLPYLLIGPGRWGSSDPRLGIPVKWSQIAGARVVVETDFANREVEPSQGAHFFHNVTSSGIGYLTISNADHHATREHRYCDLSWLDSLPAQLELGEVRHVRLEKPIRVLLDGCKSQAVILKPQ